MACYSPILAEWTGAYNSNGKKIIRFKGGYFHESDKDDPNKFQVPCGKCIGCRLDYAKKWSDRMYLEFDHTKKAVFVTLTYRDEDLPYPIVDDNGEAFFPLKKEDVSQFMKNLRGRKEFIDRELRFFASGEYGPSTHRPHYHEIIFGVDLDELQQIAPLRFAGKNELKQIYWNSPILDSVWKKGFVQVSEASQEAMNYVARYTAKKAQGDSYASDHGLPEEFSLMSRRPGIGGYFIVDHPDLVWMTKGIYTDKEKFIYFPTYILERFAKNFFGESEDSLKDIKEERRLNSIEKQNQELMQTDLDSYEQRNVALINLHKSLTILPSRRDL